MVFCRFCLSLVIIAADKHISGKPPTWNALTWFTIVTVIILTIVMFILVQAKWACSNVSRNCRNRQEKIDLLALYADICCLLLACLVRLVLIMPMRAKLQLNPWPPCYGGLCR